MSEAPSAEDVRALRATIAKLRELLDEEIDKRRGLEREVEALRARARRKART